MNEIERNRPAQPLLVQNLAKSHYACLDGLRGCAVLFVMVYHFGFTYRDVHSTNLLMQFAQLGWLGVDLFFVLSGFLITGILIESKERSHYFRNFLMRRFLRIWPLYYLSLAVFFVVAPLLLHPLPADLATMRSKQPWFWLYGANWLFASEGGFESTPGGFYWSLAVEEQFYIVWPAVVLLTSTKRLFQLSIALIAGSFVTRVALLAYGMHPGSVYVMTMTHLDSVAMGAAISACLRMPNMSLTVGRIWPAAAAVSLVGLVAVRFGDPSGFFWEHYMATYGYTLAAIFFGCVLLWALESKPERWITRALSSRPLVASGKFSYALYLIHVPIAVAAERIMLPRLVATTNYPVAFAVFIATVFLLSFLLSFLSWHLLEKRLLGLKRHFA